MYFVSASGTIASTGAGTTASACPGASSAGTGAWYCCVSASSTLLAYLRSDWHAGRVRVKEYAYEYVYKYRSYNASSRADSKIRNVFGGIEEGLRLFTDIPLVPMVM